MSFEDWRKLQHAFVEGIYSDLTDYGQKFYYLHAKLIES